MGWCFQISIDKTNTVKLCDKKPLDSEQLGNREPFPVINLLVYFMIRVQPGISEQFCHDQKFPYHKVWLYKIRISMQYRVRTKQLVNSKVRFLRRAELQSSPSSDYFCCCLVCLFKKFCVLPLFVVNEFREHSTSFEKKFHNGAFY